MQTQRSPYYPILRLVEVGKGYWRFDEYGDATRYVSRGDDAVKSRTVIETGDDGQAIFVEHDLEYDAFVSDDPTNDVVYSKYIRLEYPVWGAPLYRCYKSCVLGASEKASMADYVDEFETLEEAVAYLRKEALDNMNDLIRWFHRDRALNAALANPWHPEA